MSKSRGMSSWDAHITLTPSAQQFHTEHSLVSPYDNNPLDLTIFVSCYNEEDFIADTLESVRQAMIDSPLSYEVIVIDDVSKDNSVARVKAYIAAHPELNIVLRQNAKNKGWAQNYFDAAFLGRGKYYRVLCGDNSEPASTIKTVFDNVGKADILVPYYATSEGRSLNRQLLSKGYTWLVNFITGYRFHYYNGLAVHLRHNVMRWHPNTRGFGFQADLLCMLLDHGFTYLEIPVSATEKRKGKSNAITIKNLLSVAHTLIDIVIRRVSNRVYGLHKL